MARFISRSGVESCPVGDGLRSAVFVYRDGVSGGEAGRVVDGVNGEVVDGVNGEVVDGVNGEVYGGGGGVVTAIAAVPSETGATVVVGGGGKCEAEDIGGGRCLGLK